MTWLRILSLRIKGLFGKSRGETELDAELQSHLEALAEENIHRGMTPEEAGYAARREFGGIEQTKELYRERRGLPFLETLFQDIRYGMRMLAKNPGFTIVAVLTLALGIGANTAIYSVVHAVLLRPLPYQDSARLVMLRHPAQNMGVHDTQFSVPEINDYRAQNQTFTDVAEYHGMSFTLFGHGDPDRVRTGVISANYFPMLGVTPILGRTFTPEDEKHGAPAVLVLSYEYWRDKFGGDPEIVGKTF